MTVITCVCGGLVWQLVGKKMSLYSELVVITSTAVSLWYSVDVPCFQKPVSVNSDKHFLLFNVLLSHKGTFVLEANKPKQRVIRQQCQ